MKRADEARSIVCAAEEFGLVAPTLHKWVQAAKAGKLMPPSAKQISTDQQDCARGWHVGHDEGDGFGAGGMDFCRLT